MAKATTIQTVPKGLCPGCKRSVAITKGVSTPIFNCKCGVYGYERLADKQWCFLKNKGAAALPFNWETQPA